MHYISLQSEQLSTASGMMMISIRYLILFTFLFHLFLCGCILEEDFPVIDEEHGGENGGHDDQNFPAAEGEHDPARIVTKALLCFNDKYIYKSCMAEYRLTAGGDINVPPDYTNQYCDGPCLTETKLVLNCIHNILSHFTFYNRATIQDVRDTIRAGCSDGSERGHFNVAEHIQAEENSAYTTPKHILFGLFSSIIGQYLLL